MSLKKKSQNNLRVWRHPTTGESGAGLEGTGGLIQDQHFTTLQNTTKKSRRLEEGIIWSHGERDAEEHVPRTYHKKWKYPRMGRGSKDQEGSTSRTTDSRSWLSELLKGLYARAHHPSRN